MFGGVVFHPVNVAGHAMNILGGIGFTFLKYFLATGPGIDSDSYLDSFSKNWLYNIFFTDKEMDTKVRVQ